MYACGMSQRDISATIEDIYGFPMSHEMISDITDAVIALYVTLCSDYKAKKCAVYVILGYDLNGRKEILCFWISESEGKNQWIQFFDEIKSRGAKDVFPKVIVQHCIVHLI